MSRNGGLFDCLSAVYLYGIDAVENEDRGTVLARFEVSVLFVCVP